MPVVRNPLVSAGLIPDELSDILATPSADAEVAKTRTKRITGARYLTADEYHQMLKEDERKEKEAEELKQKKEERERKKQQILELKEKREAAKKRGKGKGKLIEMEGKDQGQGHCGH